MKRLLALLFIAVIPTIAAAQTPRTFRFGKRQGSHTAQIVFRTRTFDPTKHKIEYKPANFIDGRLAYGAESVPKIEIASMQFYLDGKRIGVPRRLYMDCYEPNIWYGKQSVGIRFSRGFQRVFVSMFGADGAGSYHVIWVLGKNGHHRRYFKDTF